MRASYIGVFFLLLFSVALLSLSRAFPDVCRYRKRQLTVGQTLSDCYANVTCLPQGKLEIKDSCHSFICERPSQLVGYNAFDQRKPYPHCCSGPVCDGSRVVMYQSASRIYRPKSFVRRSPHVMGIKFP